jgi:hypothetical protein
MVPDEMVVYTIIVVTKSGVLDLELIFNKNIRENFE